MFDENLIYDDYRNFFIKQCVHNLTAFWAMYNLQWKGKKNLDKINQLINSQESANKKQKDEVLLAQLVIKRQKIQEEIDYSLNKIYIEWWPLLFFTYLNSNLSNKLNNCYNFNKVIDVCVENVFEFHSVI